KHVPLPYLCSVKQKKTAMIKYIVRNKKNPKDKTKSASACSSHPAPPWRPPSKSSTTPTSNSSSLRWRERLQANRSVANKDQQAWRNTIFGEFGLCTIFGSFLVSFPSDTGHAPSLRNTFFWTKKCRRL
ncbi:MAG: hypothetical protein WCR53_08320, partial [Bacteroidaceae bacterium]